MRIVLVHGCWDLLTIGHLEHFERAKTLGDWLVVSVSPDEVVAKKGDGRPVRKLADRMRMLRALRCVDQVWVCRSEDATDALLHFCPAFFVQGIDYDRATDNEYDACLTVGAQRVVTQHPKEESTTDLIKRIKKCVF